MTALNVLFLCTGNSARSIIAESILRKDGGGRFHAYSAGSMPKGAVHPLALKVLASYGYPVDGLSPKTWLPVASLSSTGAGPQHDEVALSVPHPAGRPAAAALAAAA